MALFVSTLSTGRLRVASVRIGSLFADAGPRRQAHACVPVFGPRGCGKTSSARILARCIPTAPGPTSHPCGAPVQGTSPLAVRFHRRGEIDAASHNGVDDARELRERAGFAPARDRYKIFILDEAHMVAAGFDSVAEDCQEPPDHVMFIFATTEPDKVIGTIRSRTHHYPFRLVPREVMGPYLEEICARKASSRNPACFQAGDARRRRFRCVTPHQ